MRRGHNSVGYNSVEASNPAGSPCARTEISVLVDFTIEGVPA